MKRVLSLAMALLFALGLSGCSLSRKEPTAQELMKGIPQVDIEQYYDFDMELSIAAQADGQNAELSMTFGAEGRGSLLHLYDMDVSVGMTGFTFSLTMELWMDQSTDAAYSRMSLLGEDSGWISVPAASSGGASLREGLADITEGAFTEWPGASLTLAPHEEGTPYCVTGTITGEQLSRRMSGLMNGMSPDSAPLDGMDDVTFGDAAIAFYFDEESRALLRAEVQADASDTGADTSIRMTIFYNEVNGDTALAIPQNVIDTAVDGSGYL